MLQFGRQVVVRSGLIVLVSERLNDGLKLWAARVSLLVSQNVLEREIQALLALVFAVRILLLVAHQTANVVCRQEKR